MEQYIDKSALVAEIKKLIRANELYLSENASDAVRLQKTSAYSVLNDLLHFLDTLEVKELLSWQDIKLISEIGEDFMNSEESDNLSEEEYYTEILNRFKAQKGKEV